MPDIRPFRALRFDPEVVGDLGRVVAPPYDVIGPDLLTALLARSPRNAVRLDLPHEEPPEDPDERYRRVARTFAAWRSDGALRKDPRASLYVYEQVYRVPGTSLERTQRGFFARLRLEPFGPDGGVLPHERTLAGPREDRYRLLRATGVNTSPVVVLYRDPAASTRTDLDGDRGPDAGRATSPTTTARATGCGWSPTTGPTAPSGDWRQPPAPGRCSSRTATTATRRRCAIATSDA